MTFDKPKLFLSNKHTHSPPLSQTFPQKTGTAVGIHRFTNLYSCWKVTRNKFLCFTVKVNLSSIKFVQDWTNVVWCLLNFFSIYYYPKQFINLVLNLLQIFETKSIQDFCNNRQCSGYNIQSWEMQRIKLENAFCISSYFGWLWQILWRLSETNRLVFTVTKIDFKHDILSLQPTTNLTIWLPHGLRNVIGKVC